MVVFKKKHRVLDLIILFLLLLLNLSSIPISKSKENENPINYCGSIKIQSPFHLQKFTPFSSSTSSSSSSSTRILSKLLLCKSKKLYFRTSIGLFHISSIDYSRKFLTISHTCYSSTSHFISSTLLSSGFPPLPDHPNSLVFFNCSSSSSSSSAVSPFLRVSNCSNFINGCGVSSSSSSSSSSSECLVLEDLMMMRNNNYSFDPREMNCTHYSRIHKNGDGDGGGYELGTRISFDIIIPDHVPNPCNECKKPYGNCGVGLRCICHLNQCKDKVLSNGVIRRSSCGSWGTIFSINHISFIFVMIIFITFNQP